MNILLGDAALLGLLQADERLRVADHSELSRKYEEISAAFHSHLSTGSAAQHENALFHKIRYLEMLRRPWTGKVLDVGNDKPFLSYFLRLLNPGATFFTISYEIPESPFDIYNVDLEAEELSFAPETFDWIIFTEVIEHLWRNPSLPVHCFSRVLKTGGRAYITTPNPCDKHSLVCILWQANPNQRSGYYSTLESGHLHLWTAADLRTLLSAHGFSIESLTTENLYGHTKDDQKILAFVSEISPFVDLMNEAIVLIAKKETSSKSPQYPLSIFPDGVPVQPVGAITSFWKEREDASNG